MEKIRLLLLVAFLLTSVALPLNAAELRVATFNCEFLTKPKLHVKYGLSFSLKDEPAAVREKWQNQNFLNQKFEEAAESVADVLVKTKADVLALTEVGNEEDVKVLLKKLKQKGVNYPYYLVGNTLDKSTWQHTAILSKIKLTKKLKEIPGRESYLIEIDDPETEKETGLSKGVRAVVKVGGKDVYIYCVHFKSERGGVESDMQRVAQASIVRRHYLPLLNEGKHIIVAGDLNDKRGQPTLRRIRGLDDIWGDLIQTGLHKNSSKNEYFSKDDVDKRWTYKFLGFPQQIDHILLSRSLKSGRRNIKAETLIHGNHKASDHNALIVSVKIPE